METLIFEKTENIGVVTFNRPQALNALNSQVMKELLELLGFLKTDTSLRCVIFTGSGEKSFIAGADIKEMAAMTVAQASDFSKAGHLVLKDIAACPFPFIAAVNGFALGGGTEMAIACDFIVASDKAVFGQPEVSLGIIPGFGANLRLPKFVGLPKAKELIFSGRRIKADEALAIGLVNHVYPAQDFMKHVLELAKTISQQSFHAVARAKQLLNEFGESTGLNFKLDAEAQAFGRLFGSHDQREGMGAFVEKRKPSFQGL